MSLWLLLTAMIAVAAVFTATPFIRTYERKRIEREKTLGIYRDQLKEIDVEATQGGVDAAQLEASRAEIKRRLIAASLEEQPHLPGMSNSERTFSAIAATVVVVIGSVALFGLTADLEPAASPSLATAPAAQAAAAPIARSGNPPAAAAAPSEPATAAAGAPKGLGNLPSVEDLVQRLIARLDKNPKDVEGWRMLGWSYFGMNRFDDAAKAYARAMELNPNSAEYRDGRIESLVRAGNGIVSADALSVVDDTLRIQPRHSRAMFVKALAIEQSGDRAGAAKMWNDMLHDLEPNDPWVKEVKKKLGAAPAEGTASEKTGPLTSSAPSVPDATQDAEPRGPTAEQVRAADTMSSTDRSAMIRQMVGQLAARLEASPRDSDGWVRLIRSWMVLGETDKAKQALDASLKAFSDDPDQMRKLTDAGREAGLK